MLESFDLAGKRLCEDIRESAVEKELGGLMYSNICWSFAAFGRATRSMQVAEYDD